MGKKAHITATRIAGSILATLIFVLSHTRFTPTQKISIFPTSERLLRVASVISGSMHVAKRVTEPCRIPTGIAEKIHPFPIEAVITHIIIQSRIAFVKRVE